MSEQNPRQMFGVRLLRSTAVRLALGYAGWGPGQLDAEMQANGWLTAESDESLMFDRDLETKWERSIAKLGVRLSMLSGEAGHA